jgi:hypothetical protein
MEILFLGCPLFAPWLPVFHVVERVDLGALYFVTTSQDGKFLTNPVFNIQQLPLIVDLS